MKFYDRTTGLKKLEEFYTQSRGAAVLNVITGRQRMGKTRLIGEFAKGKKNILYFLVEEKETRLLLEDFQVELKKKLGSVRPLRNWDDFFRLIFDVAKITHLVLILDEFQNFRWVDEKAITAFQKQWDTNKAASRILVLCLGSAIRQLRGLFAGHGAPLSERTSGFFRLTPFNYLQAREMLEDLGFENEEEKVVIYSILGGTPGYLEMLEGLKGVKEVIMNLFLGKRAPLREEPFSILTKSPGGHAIKLSILQAVSRGKFTIVEIGKAIGLSPTSLSRYMTELVEDDLLVRKVPVTDDERASKRGRYFIVDPFLRFWFRFIYSNRQLIEWGETNLVWEKIKKHLNSLVAETFRDIIMTLFSCYNGRSLMNIPISFDRIGPWWDRRGNEADLCAISREGAILGEVRWSAEKIGIEAIHEMQRTWQRMKLKGEPSYFLVSKGGLTEECAEFMRARNFLALSLADVQRAFESL
jgi:hypothetical protein